MGLSALLINLSGCASKAQLVRELPSPELLRDTTKPLYSVKTNGELAKGIIALEDALDKCNIDKSTLRVWTNKE